LGIVLHKSGLVYNRHDWPPFSVNRCLYYIAQYENIKVTLLPGGQCCHEVDLMGTKPTETVSCWGKDLSCLFLPPRADATYEERNWLP